MIRGRGAYAVPPEDIIVPARARTDLPDVTLEQLDSSVLLVMWSAGMRWSARLGDGSTCIMAAEVNLSADIGYGVTCAAMLGYDRGNRSLARRVRRNRNLLGLHAVMRTYEHHSSYASYAGIRCVKDIAP